MFYNMKNDCTGKKVVLHIFMRDICIKKALLQQLFMHIAQEKDKKLMTILPFPKYPSTAQ